MADEDEEYSYVPNEAVINAVGASGLRTGRVQGATIPNGMSREARAISSTVIPVGNLSPRRRAEYEAKIQQQREQAAHNAAMESVARAKYALDATHSYYENAKTRNELIQQANQMNEAAGFLSDHAQLNPYAPDYYKHVNELAAKYPGASDNKIVQGIVANPKLREQAALKGDVPGEVATRNAFKNGWLKHEDLANPQLRNEDGSFNHDAASELATLREGASVEPPHVKTARAGLAEVNRLGTDLTPQQEGLRDMYSNTIYQFEKGRQETLGIPQPKKVSAGSFLPRAAAPTAAVAPVGAVIPAQQTSIPQAPPPPTPAPQPISPEEAARNAQRYFNE